MKRRKSVASIWGFLLLSTMAVSSFGALSVQTKDSDGQNQNVDWRRIDFRLLNDGPTDVDMQDVTLEYIIAGDTTDGLESAVWHYNVHPLDWSYSGGQAGEVNISFQNIGDNISVTMTFASRTLPANGEAIVQIGVHYSNWTVVDESDDLSYLDSTDFADNGDVLINGEGGTTTLSGFKQIVASSSAICGIRVDGKTECWGANYYNKATPFENVLLSKLYGGDNHVCGLEVGTNYAFCWGDNEDGQASPPANVAFTMLATGDSMTCGIRQDNSEAMCWGAVDDLQYAMPVGSQYQSIAVSHTTVCAAEIISGAVECWGRDTYGQIPGPPKSIKITELYAGNVHFCGIREDNGDLYCWGIDGGGQSSTAPVGQQFQQLNLGNDYSCGIRSDGTIRCWGGAVNDWYIKFSELPNPFGQTVAKSIAAVHENVCIVRKIDGVVECFGTDPSGAGTAPAGIEFVDMSHQGKAFCGIKAADNTLSCWGSEQYNDDLPAPSDVAFSQVSATDSLSCGIRSSDSFVQCWEDVDSLVYPADVAYDKIDVNYHHACAVRSSDGQMDCWGSNFMEQATPPAGVAFGDVAVASGYSCGIREDNQNIECWGRLVTGSSWNLIDRTPTPGVAYVSVAASRDNLCGIRANDGEVECWGNDYYGVLDSPAGVQFFEVAAGLQAACGLRVSDGKPQCWGDGADSGYYEINAPDVELISLDGTALSFCGVRADDGTQVCWGLIARGIWR